MLSIKNIYIDTSHLNKLISDYWCSTTEHRRHKSREFLDKLESNGFIVFLSHHTLQELLAHENDDIVLERLNFIHNLPVLSTALEFNNNGVVGHWMDVLRAEIKFHLTDPEANYLTMCNSLKDQIIGHTSGPKLLNYASETYLALRDIGEFETQSAAEHESLLQSNEGRSIDNVKIRNLDNYQFKTKAEIAHHKSDYIERTTNSLIKHGDKKLINRESIAKDFAGKVFAGEDYLISATDKPDSNAYLKSRGVSPDQVSKNATFKDVTEISVFNAMMHDFVVDGTITSEEALLIDRDKIPSWTIVREIENLMRAEPRATGSSLIDRYHLPFVSYIDAMTCDKRVSHYLNISKNSHPILQQARERCKSAPSYSDLI